MRRVMITGAGGQLGLELLAGLPTGIKGVAVDLQELDITDAGATARLIAELRPHWIINCAAYTAVDRAESEPELAWRVNRDGAYHLAAAARDCGARMVQVSTDFVFDGRGSRPYRTDDAPNPLGVYGASKLAGERAVLQASDGDALIVRTAWLYSVHGSNFIKTMLRLLRERPEVRVVADQVGTPTSATTLAAALWRLIDIGASGGVWHCTDAGVASWYDLACAVREALPGMAPLVPIRTEDYPTPAQRPAYSVLDKTATVAALGTPLPHWREALQPVLAQLTATS